MEFKNVLIIGTSVGIGKALALEYANTGHNLVLLSRNLEAIKELAVVIVSKGVKCFYQQCDVSVYEQVRDGISFAQKSLGTIDLAIINAGIGSPEWMSGFRSSELKRIYNTNVFGIAHSLEFLIPIMKLQGYGKIAGVSSLADVRGYSGSSAYASSKAAASRLLETARVELKLHNINVITVKPGFVKTAMTDKNEFTMPFIMPAEKAARIIRKGIDKNKSVVQFPFPIAAASWIIKNMPNWLYDRLIRMSRPIKD